ncbi:uncharacterized protein JCM6883_000532 [Sporobolomyces salmoneus]|uniref:uncharacterized protein n=1 Tax=Sporobolomyces salmoneus TaxID=183962 RepID=UPI0031770B4C
MATLERTRDSTSTTTAVDRESLASTYAPSGSVPTAFPPQSQERGRSLVSQPGRMDSDPTTQSRSPNGTKRSLSKLGDRIKKAVNQAREPSLEPSDRGRRASDTPTTEEPRGRSPFTAFSPRTASRGRQSINSTATGQYPLSASQTRDTSRGRSTIGGGGKMVSSGRGGAGNLVSISNEEEDDDLRGEEDPNLVKQIREDRSKSREREGRFEVASSGRGGRGNIRSTSRGRDLELGRVPTVLEEQERAEREDELLREEEYRRREERERATPQPQRWVSSGRGGAGNFHSWGSKSS